MGSSYGENNLYVGLKCLNIMYRHTYQKNIMYRHSVKSLNTDR
jgi:3-deoxy-D-manno-octulosonic acid (KDO) 8-phosphate synthase